MKVWVRVFLGMVCAAVFAEAALQLVAHWLTPASRAQVLAGAGQHLRVLAVGDSNTFGLFLPEEDAWPAQLQRLTVGEQPPLEVVNVGYPGTNSFRVLANLPELLAQFSPDIVLLMVGFNDFWTPVEDVAAVELVWW